MEERIIYEHGGFKHFPSGEECMRGELSEEAWLAARVAFFTKYADLVVETSNNQRVAPASLMLQALTVRQIEPAGTFFLKMEDRR